jgi:Uma2 family endonuclease
MSDAIIEANYVTEDDLLALDSDALVEVVDGAIVEMTPVGALHHFITGNVYRILDAYVQVNPIGFVFMDGLIYILFTEGKRLRGSRVPDVSFIRKESIPKDWDITRPIRAAPTLAVEVMSPDDKVEDVLKKVREYLRAGSEQVWVMYPGEREVHQYRHDDPNVRVYTGDATMDVESLFPGLTLTLTEVFRLPKL